MTKKKYRNLCISNLFLSIIYIGLLINFSLKPFSILNLVLIILFGILIFQTLQLAVLMYRKYKELDLK